MLGFARHASKPMLSRRTVQRWLAAALFAFPLTPLFVRPADSATLRLKARKIYQRSVSNSISLSRDGAILELKSGEVFQDDGPASGFSYKPNKETLGPGIEIRKQLVIPDPRASEAVLMMGGSGEFEIQINGQIQKSGPPKKIFYGEWQAYNIDPEALRPGVNEIVISGAGTVDIARADDAHEELPHRSARSLDGGKTWNADKLGPAGDIAGEYYVRMYLKHFSSSGTLRMPVMDIANLPGNAIAPVLGVPGPLRVSASSIGGSEDTVTLRVRSGTTYVPSPDSWSDWMLLDGNRELEEPRGRFVQLEFTLATADPRSTPKLNQITVTTEPKLAKDWTRSVRVVDVHNEEIVRTSIPFRYEPFTQPALKELRASYQLDEVVGSAKTDLEILTRLAAWSSHRWKWAEWHLDEYYPPWDAVEILKVQPDGKPVGGFCQQYNLVFLQAAESFGYVGREISISSGTLGRPTSVGHEAVEFWSNQFRKWIWVDGMYAEYAEDSASGVPLSLWELRQRQLRTFRGESVRPTRIVHIQNAVLLRSMPSWLKQAMRWHSLQAGMSFAELRLIPRSNFLEQQWPLPLNNGKGGWSWDGFDVWSDAEVPAEPIYPNLIAHTSNFEWTLNQAHFVLEPVATAGEFIVHLDTETPGFETFLAETDQAETAPVKSIFHWKLHPGRNHLKVWPRNNAGRDGISSWIDLELQGM